MQYMRKLVAASAAAALLLHCWLLQLAVTSLQQQRELGSSAAANVWGEVLL
jgi:hypothetical protein